MRDAAGKLSEAFQLLGLAELFLERLTFRKIDDEMIVTFFDQFGQ